MPQILCWFIYLGFYVAFNTVQVISRRVVGRPEETSTYSLLGFCTVNCRSMASNYQLSHLRLCQELNPFLRGGRQECYHSAIVAPKYYVGETTRALSKTIYEHKATVQKDGQVTPVSRHFKSEGHNHKHMQFTVLEWCTPKFESSHTFTRRRTELFWIFRLHSLAPLASFN